MDIKKLKYTSGSKLVLNGSISGSVHTVDIDLDDNYDLCTGLCFGDRGAGLGSAYTIGLQNQNGSILDPLPADAVVTAKEDGSSPNDRFLETAFAIKGAKRVTMTITLSAAATADTTVDVTFRMVRIAKPVSI
jgi:hypothetical protein